MDEELARRYKQLLADFCAECSAEDETVLSKARDLIQEFVEGAATSGDIVALHTAAVEELALSGDTAKFTASRRFLLESMIAFGAAYSTFAERLLAEAVSDAANERGHAEEVERSEKERLELLAGVSHELGNPLTVIKGNVTAIRRSLEQSQNWPVALSPRANDVEFAVDRLLALRDELLAASRNEERELEHVPVHLLRTLQRAVRWAKTRASEKGIHITEDDTTTIPYILGDEGALQSILSNLVSNAVRYTPQGGRIQVAASNEGDRVVVAITDTGIGMSEAEQQRIFERFYRTPAAQETAAFGLGLGLAITRDLVSALGGTIAVDSNPGAGSTFTVTFPAADIGAEDL